MTLQPQVRSSTMPENAVRCPSVERRRRARRGLAAAAAIAGAAAAAPVAAQEACTQMQVYLAIAPNHREDVMSYIAPRIKQKFGADPFGDKICAELLFDSR